jgi:hypothetical protein
MDDVVFLSGIDYYPTRRPLEPGLAEPLRQRLAGVSG